jgi:ABC-type antimicrobial peptide transport system, permease component
MNFSNLIKIAWQALLRNKTRSILTMLGIIIGIASVIAMVGIGESSTASVSQQISSTGTNMIMVTRSHQRTGGVNVGNTNVRSLKAANAAAILESPYVAMATPSVTAVGQIIYGSNNWPGSIQGANSSYLEIRKYEVAKGANFSELDVYNSAKVCLVGQTVVDNIFGNEDPLGKVIRFGKIPLKIIGVLESKGQNQMGQDQDDIVIAPYTTVQKRILAITHVHMLMASAVSEEMVDLAAADIDKILRTEHKLKTTEDNDFEVRTQKEMLEMMDSVTGMLTILLAAIAAISLLVGGIGIMNIMYVTVTERTREIGLRMSIGAKNKDILQQFLFESTILSLIGGIIGIALGIGLSYVACYFLNWPFAANVFIIIISFAVCAIIGIFFGWYPARKAANLDPINALRYE